MSFEKVANPLSWRVELTINIFFPFSNFIFIIFIVLIQEVFIEIHFATKQCGLSAGGARKTHKDTGQLPLCHGMMSPGA
jgi:hypothetical protein